MSRITIDLFQGLTLYGEVSSVGDRDDAHHRISFKLRTDVVALCRELYHHVYRRACSSIG